MSEASKRQDTALYKHPGKQKIHGSMFDYKVVDRNDKEAFDAALDDGWCTSTSDALKCSGGKTLKEIEQKQKQAEGVPTVATTKKSKPGRPKKYS